MEIISHLSHQLRELKSTTMKIKLLNALIIINVLLMPQALFGQTPNLGTASNFAMFTSVGTFHNVGTTYITGDIGTNSGAFSGFTSGFVVGNTHLADPVAAQAAIDLNIAYNDLSALTCGSVLGVGLGTRQTLTPNVYCIGAASTLNGFLTLDAQSNPNAVFIIKIDGGLTTTASSNVVLINGAKLENVFWQVNGAVILGQSSVFKGTIIANGAISLLDGASLLGRGLTRQGAISLERNNSAVVLPIDLVYFTAQKQENVLLLNWATVSERNIVRYELQRSDNARDFETLTSFLSLGRASDKNVYSFLDKSPFEKVEGVSPSIIYYRVKQVDINNTFEYSKVIAVVNETTSKVSIYPNPASYQITVKGSANVQPFTITNTVGKIVSSGQYTATNALDISHLPAGFYSLNIQSMNIRFLKN